ncbi:MAG: hypothetical protein LBK94_02895 [Prevotellaceae bacterium]|jgi:hypothetical protein|nr:hypothetical protein [Prevotellaceae bacterium]
MGLINIYSYIHAIIYGIPLGLAFLIGGFKALKEFKSEYLIKVECSIVDIKDTIVKTDIKSFNYVAIKASNGNMYYVGANKIKDYLNNIQYKNKPVVMWHLNTDKSRYIVMQFFADGKYYMKNYKTPYWIAYIFIILGIITFSSALAYVIKHPEELRFKKKK